MWERYCELAPAALLWVFAFAILWRVHKRLERLIAAHILDAAWTTADRRIGQAMEVLEGDILAPIFEELLFRLPLLVVFERAHGFGAIGLIAVSLVFGLSHLTNDHTNYDEVLAQKHADTKALKAAMAVAKKEQAERSKRITVLQVISSTLGGLLMGYAGLSLRSITACILIHIVWNLFAPAISRMLLTVYLFVRATITVLERVLHKNPHGKA